MNDESVELDKTSNYGVDLSQRMDCAKSEPGGKGDPLNISLKEISVRPAPSASLLSVFNLTRMKTFSNAMSILVILVSSTFVRAQRHHHAAEDGDANAAIEKFSTAKGHCGGGMLYGKPLSDFMTGTMFRVDGGSTPTV
jgi:hypothetical protein